MSRCLRFSPKDLAAILPKNPPSKGGIVGVENEPTSPPLGELGDILNQERKIREAKMNKTEMAFSELLESAKETGEILRWEFEAVSLKVGPNTRYNPDFLIVMPDGHWQLVEIKGFLRDDAAVKFKAAAGKYPELSFIMLRRKKGAWETIYNLPCQNRRNKKTVDFTQRDRKTQP